VSALAGATPTPSQTIGPFFRSGFSWMRRRELVGPDAPGAVRLEGRVLDGDGAAVPDAVIEVFQADADGGYNPPWSGFGRCLTDGQGRYQFLTVKPGPVDEHQAPHIDVSVFARGVLQRLLTRVYFPDEAEANAADPLLRSIGDAGAAQTLIGRDGGDRLEFDIRLQGEGETVFLAW
jgi:protocatechuate 3,4-dioxygenase, alpha subunit